MLGRPSAVFFDEADQAQCGHDSCGKAPRTGHDFKVNHTETQLAYNVTLLRMVVALNRAGTVMQHNGFAILLHLQQIERVLGFNLPLKMTIFD